LVIIVWIRYVNNLEGVQIKRGAFFEKLLNYFFAMQSLRFRESVFQFLGFDDFEVLKYENLGRGEDYFLPFFSSETVNLCLPLALLLARTLLPLADSILALKPCLFFLFLCEGWNVLFIV